MDYGTVLSKFSACMTEIGNALRKINGTTKKYKFTEIASAINECTQVYYLGTGTSFNVSNIPDYQNLTKDNFIIRAISASFSAGEYGGYWNLGGSFTPTVSYDSNTGVAKITGTSFSNSWRSDDGGANYHESGSLSFDVYLIKGKIKQL